MEEEIIAKMFYTPWQKITKMNKVFYPPLKNEDV